MESFMLLGFVGNLRESLKIFSNNGKLMASLSLLTLPIYSLCYLCNISSIKPVISNLLFKQSLLSVTDPKSPVSSLLLVSLKEDLRAFFGLEWIYVLISTAVSLFSATAAIIAAAMIHGSRNLSFKELLLSTITSLKRPVFTWFYTTLLVLSYVFSRPGESSPHGSRCSAAFHRESPGYNPCNSSFGSLHLLAIIWSLAFFVSVLEEKSGVEALGKAAQIVKGLQLNGFLLNLVSTILFIIPHVINLMMGSKKFSAIPVIVGLVLVNYIFLVKLHMFAAYTVFYYQCKKFNGEEVELQWGSGNNKVPTLPLLNKSLA